MTTQQPSRATLQDVLAAIDAAPDVTGKRKQDLRSAVRLVAKVIGQDPGNIVADPRGLGRRLDAMSPLSLGLTAERWANVRSLLRSALRLVRPVMPGANSAPLLPEWEALAGKARAMGASWQSLSRLVRWLSEKVVPPGKVTLTDVEAFRTVYFSDALLGNPAQTWKHTKRSWERVRKACPEWPQIPLENEPDPRHFSLPWETFPASLKAEVDLLLERLAGKDWSDEGPIKPLRTVTLRGREHDLHSFVSALVYQGRKPEELTSLAICLSLENYKAGLRWFYDRYGAKSSRTMHNLAARLRLVARHWLKADEATLAGMARVVKLMAPPEQGMSDKNRERLRPFESKETLIAFVNLPEKIRRHIETATSAKARKAGLSTAAVAIAILLNTPVRLGNLCGLHLDRHIIRVGSKTHLYIPADEVKNGKELEFELADETVEIIDWYVAHYRRADSANRYLFAGAGLNPKSHDTLRQQIMNTIHAFTGLTVHPHLFRHLMATIYLAANPGGYEVVRLTLGHRNIATTSNFYAGQAERSARKHFTDTVLALQEKQPAQIQKNPRRRVLKRKPPPGDKR